MPAFSAQHVALHPRPGFDSAEQEIIRQIVDMERQSKEASLRRDSDFSLRTLAEDYVAITPLGQVTTKQETISARRSGQLRYEAMNITDMVVRVYGDTAVVTARADVKGHQLAKISADPIATPASGFAATASGKPSATRRRLRNENSALLRDGHSYPSLFL